MRAGANTVQQTLTPEAAAVLKHAVAEACRRGHCQTTPLHVIATLLCAPASPLRRACLQTHSHSSHLPQGRALELCFSVALERMQAAQGSVPGGQPSYSNALVAALKRAQAQQRRGCPEQQQQPLLAVKVELEQLVISILDDPSVSRVMGEAGLSSTDVKNHLEETVSLMSARQSLPTGCADQARLSWGGAIDQIGPRLSTGQGITGKFSLSHSLPSYSGLSIEKNDPRLLTRPAKTASVYLNPTLQGSGSVESFVSGGSDLKRVLEVMLRRRRRNPVLVSDSKTRGEAIIRDLVHRIEKREVPAQLQGAKFLHTHLSFETLRSASKEIVNEEFVELNNAVKQHMPGGAIIYLRDMQWLLDSSKPVGWASRSLGFCPVQYATLEMRHLLNQHSDSGRLWLVGLATSETYFGCQFQHPTLESQWELHPLTVGSSGLTHSLSSRCMSKEPGVNSVNSILTLSLKPSHGTSLKLNSGNNEGVENLDCHSDCKLKEDGFLHEQGRHGLSEFHKSSSAAEISTKPTNVGHPVQPAHTSQTGLPLWLQKALPASSINESEPVEEHTIITASDDVNLSASARPIGNDRCSPSSSPSGALNQSHAPQIKNGHQQQMDVHKERVDPVTDCSLSSNGLTGQAPAISSPIMPRSEAATPNMASPRLFRQMDSDAFKIMCKGLAERVSWQKGVISTIANTVMECRYGSKKRSGVSLKGDAWLLFLGYDKAGKKMMAEALSELIFGYDKKPLCINFGFQQDLSLPSTWSLGLQQLSVPSRGKLPLEQVAEAVRQNPFSLILLEEVDKADLIFKSSLLRAMEKGRLSMTNGRDVSFSNTIVVMTSSVGTDSCTFATSESKAQCAQERFATDMECTFQCRVKNTECSPRVDEQSSDVAHKRKGEWNAEDKAEILSVANGNKRPALALDLNVCVEQNEIVDSSECDGVHTVCATRDSKFEFSEDLVLSCARKQLKEICDLADAAVIFHPV